MGVFAKIFVLLLIGRLVAATSNTFREVNSDFPNSMTNCLQEKRYFHPDINPSLPCAAACNQNANCRLFCTKGNECWLFNTFVTGEYVGAMGGGSFGFSSCYTSWFFKNNVADRAIVSTSSFYFANSEQWATDGYFCFEYDSCTITSIEYRPHYVADLQSIYEVNKIIVKARDDNLDFQNVEIRFGNSPTFSNNPVFASHTGITPSPGTLLTFQVSQPMQGRYLSFQTMEFTTAALALCEVQILKAEIP